MVGLGRAPDPEAPVMAVTENTSIVGASSPEKGYKANEMAVAKQPGFAMSVVPAGGGPVISGMPYQAPASKSGRGCFVP